MHTQQHSRSAQGHMPGEVEQYDDPAGQCVRCRVDDCDGDERDLATTWKK